MMFKTQKLILTAAAVPALVLGLASLPSFEKKQPVHSPEELKVLRRLLAVHQTHGNPTMDTMYFPLAGRCAPCHGRDASGFGLITDDGTDVNMYDDWRSSIMANATKDPYWRAKVMHEIQVNPAHSEALQDKCTSCHAPAGHYQSKLSNSAPHYLFEQAITDTLGLDGVTCQACHAQSPLNDGRFHSGEIHYDLNQINVSYGPFPLVYAPPMIQQVGLTPKYSEHINDAGVCAGCHTLLTHSVDLNGAFTGSTFIEQATYHEWLNSRYDEQHDSISCQGCHLPKLEEPVVIASGLPFLTAKGPIGLHEMAGANVSMLKMMKEHRTTLGIKAQPPHFDSTIAATLRMLQHNTLDLVLEPVQTFGDSAQFSLKLINKAGHKFPSGYPSRRAWVELKIVNAQGETIFHSGQPAADGGITGEDSQYEPHYQVIRDPGQVQIYELVPGDVNQQFTTVLERAHVALKDNRLVPQGFSLADPVYDTTTIVGMALTDPDFNRDAAGAEGTGSDMVHFRVPINGYTGTYTVQANVWYQSLPPKWINPVFAFNSPHITQFQNIFNAADHAPVLVKAVELANVPVAPVSVHTPDLAQQIKVFPTLSNTGKVNISLPDNMPLSEVRIWNSRGQLVWQQATPVCWLPDEKGVYWVEVRSGRYRKAVKVVRQ